MRSFFLKVCVLKRYAAGLNLFCWKWFKPKLPLGFQSNSLQLDQERVQSVLGLFSGKQAQNREPIPVINKMRG